MWLHINPRSGVPVYQQVVDGIKEAVAKGALLPGDRLPSVRDLTVELEINHNTVAKAYQELERHHIIEVIRGRGTFVALEPSAPEATKRLADLRREMTRWVVEAHHLKLKRGELLDMLHSVIGEIDTAATPRGGIVDDLNHPDGRARQED